jgi:hypothetical protein
LSARSALPNCEATNSNNAKDGTSVVDAAKRFSWVASLGLPKPLLASRFDTTMVSAPRFGVQGATFRIV